MTRGDSNGDDDGEREDGNWHGINIEFGLSLKDLLEGLDADSPRDPEKSLGPRPGTAPRAGSSAGEGETTPNVDSHVETYREDDELTVVADLPGVDHEDVSAGIGEQSTDLLIVVDDGVVERVSQPWDVVEVVGATFNNGVLEIQLRAVEETTD